MKNGNFYTVTGWMVNELGLSGNELVCYAIIYGFSQDGESMFMGSLKYLAEWMNVSKNTAINSLKSLMEKGYIRKVEATKNNVRYCYYQDALSSQEGGIPNFGMGGMPNFGTHINNNINNKKDNNRLLSKKAEVQTELFQDTEPTKEGKFDSWFKLKYPILSKNQRPLTLSGFERIQSEGFSSQEIKDKLDVMEAKKGFNRKYSDVGRTCLTWLKMDKDPRYSERFRNKKADDDKKA